MEEDRCSTGRQQFDKQNSLSSLQEATNEDRVANGLRIESSGKLVDPHEPVLQGEAKLAEDTRAEVLEKSTSSTASTDSWETAEMTASEHEVNEQELLQKMTVLFVREEDSSSDVGRGISDTPRKMTVLLEPEDDMEIPTRGSSSLKDVDMCKITKRHEVKGKPIVVRVSERHSVRCKRITARMTKTRPCREKKVISYDEVDENVMKTVKVPPEFVKQFQAHAKHMDKLKTGAVITKHRSQLWLMKAGLLGFVITDREASESFSWAAGTGVVLNVQNYVRYLKWISLKKELEFEELLVRLAECSPMGMEPEVLEPKKCAKRHDISQDMYFNRSLQYTCSLPSLLLN